MAGDYPSGTRSGLDKWFTDLFVVAIIVSVCCNGLFFIPLIVNIIGYFTCKDPLAKRNAMICMIISIVLVAIGLALNFLGVLGGLMGNR